MEETGGGGEALALLEAEAGEGLGGGSGEPGAGEAERARALEAGTAAKLLRAEGEFAAAKVDWEVRARLRLHAAHVSVQGTAGFATVASSRTVSSVMQPRDPGLAAYCDECCTTVVQALTGKAWDSISSWCTQHVTCQGDEHLP